MPYSRTKDVSSFTQCSTLPTTHVCGMLASRVLPETPPAALSSLLKLR